MDRHNDDDDNDDDDNDADTTGGRIIVCSEFLIPSQTKRTWKENAVWYTEQTDPKILWVRQEEDTERQEVNEILQYKMNFNHSFSTSM